MVTVDGPKNIHDQRRIMTGGQGTFDQIQKGICDSLNHGIRTIVRVNIDQTNIDYVSLLVDYYKKTSYLKMKISQFLFRLSQIIHVKA
ncbi:hypothetical protein AAHB49_15685 [Bacillus cereus]